jgi:outer membrane protein OmpA-like peptidoglycan-associated protein
MNRSVAFALFLFVAGAILVGAWKLLEPGFRESAQQREAERKQDEVLRTSDTQPLRPIRIGGDGYIGYWFVTSPELKLQAQRRGLAIQFTDDKGAYAERLQKFANKEYDCILLPVNSYLVHGQQHDYPGSIVAAVAESKGADGIVVVRKRFPLGKVDELDDPTLRFVYTADSPSEFLIDLTAHNANLVNLTAGSGWQVEVGSSAEVLDRAKKHDGDVFVMWEPELSRALAEDQELVYLWGSDKFSGYIKDVFVFHRDFILRREADLVRFFEGYFLTLRVYGNDQARWRSEVRTATGLSEEQAAAMLAKVDFYDLHENCRLQFGIQPTADTVASEGVVKTINACTDVLVQRRRLPRDPLGGDCYRIVYSKVVQALLDQAPQVLGKQPGLAVDFQPLDDAGWSRLQETFTLRVEPITFKHGSAELDDKGKDAVDRLAALVVDNYPEYRVAIRGHTGVGDEAQNLALSRERAEVVAKRLIAVHQVDPDRIRAEGHGSARPPKRRPGESERAFGYRLPRVEFVLLEGGNM